MSTDLAVPVDAIADTPVTEAVVCKECVVLSWAPDYHIYDDGRVFWVGRNRWLTPCLDLGGYHRVVLHVRHNDKLRSTKLNVGSLVCEAFVGPRPSKLHSVDHINRARTDNRAENVRWALPTEQAANQGKHRRSESKRYAHPVIQLHRIHDTEVARYPSITAAAEAMASAGKSKGGVVAARSGIWGVMRRKPNAVAYGFRWRRVNPEQTMPTPVDDVEDEEWREVEGKERLSVSNIGRIKERSEAGVERIIHCPRQRPLAVDWGQYRYVYRSDAGVIVRRNVSLLVADAFLTSPTVGVGKRIQWQHRNGDKLDDRACNLVAVEHAAPLREEIESKRQCRRE